MELADNTNMANLHKSLPATRKIEPRAIAEYFHRLYAATLKSYDGSFDDALVVDRKRSQALWNQHIVPLLAENRVSAEEVEDQLRQISMDLVRE